ncbi:polysaccharide biosynthesis C-terminal domain-containing protein [Nocardiopsis dassonvillei]|uniref:lipopolysaccharide biosynthesis protein n=1 Tax=Nocardiopsis dassonvillei TaxID=2014 RepID=UPI00200C993D|nr:polysaccharide biosynthesis C-terminal domain-containing protein [Nocardiopsis dassonvillei]MCK9870833.1 polysaccharide biosynthesis C-terminal domain-containing protein [Nocardiopsis dassonvillei]
MGARPLVARVTAAAERERAGLRRVLRGGAVNMAGAVVGAALNLAVIVTITRAFSQETAGLLFSATSVFLIAAVVANLGASDGLVYFIARMRVFGEPGGVPRLLRTAAAPAVLAACALAVLLVVCAGPVARGLGGGEAEVYLRLLAVFLPFAVLADTALAATRAHHDMAGTVLVDKVGRPLAQLALVTGVALSGAAGLLALAWAGPYLPAAVVAWFWLGRVVRRAFPEAGGASGDADGSGGAHGSRGADALGKTHGSGDADALGKAAPVGKRGTYGAPSATGTAVDSEIGRAREESATTETAVAPEAVEESVERLEARTFWAFSLPRAVAAVAQMGVQRGGVVLVALLGGLTGAAVFTAATRVMVVGQFGTQAVLYAAQPRFAEQLATGDHAGVRALYQAGTAWLVCLLWPLYLSVLVFAPQVMRLFGPEYAAGATALVVVCAGQLTAAALGMSDLVLTMTGLTRLNLVNNVLSLAANVLVCVLLVPVAGATGAAVALVAAMLVRKLLPLWQLRSHVVLHPFSRPVLAATASALTWFGVLPLLLEALLGGGIATLAMAVASGAVGHLVTVWSLRGLLGLDPRR